MARVFDSAGKLLFTTDANQKTTRYWFDGAGNPLQITDVLGLNITANYNDFGHRLNVTDPDRGTWNFTHNGFGEFGVISTCAEPICVSAMRTASPPVATEGAVSMARAVGDMGKKASAGDWMVACQWCQPGLKQFGIIDGVPNRF